MEWAVGRQRRAREILVDKTMECKRAQPRPSWSRRRGRLACWQRARWTRSGGGVRKSGSEGPAERTRTRTTATSGWHLAPGALGLGASRGRAQRTAPGAHAGLGHIADAPRPISAPPRPPPAARGWVRTRSLLLLLTARPAIDLPLIHGHVKCMYEQQQRTGCRGEVEWECWGVCIVVVDVWCGSRLADPARQPLLLSLRGETRQDASDGSRASAFAGALRHGTLGARVRLPGRDQDGAVRQRATGHGFLQRPPITRRRLAVALCARWHTHPQRWPNCSRAGRCTRPWGWAPISVVRGPSQGPPGPRMLRSRKPMAVVVVSRNPAAKHG